MVRFLYQNLTDFLTRLDLVRTDNPPPPAGSYPYRRLVPRRSELRLLTLHPGTWDSEIICNIKHASLDSNPDYEALSYTWGSLTDLRCIFVDGYEVKVSANLEIALRYLRSPDETRTLWIDALCINQEDTAERNAQVPRMYTIYSKARTVLAWLGEPGADGVEGMELMAKFGRIIFDQYAAGKFKIADMGFTWMRTQGLDVCTENWTALYNLWNRPFWSRIWVVQELASSIVVGPMLFDKSLAERPERCLIGCGKNWIESKLYTSLGLFLTGTISLADMLFNFTWTRGDRGIFQVVWNGQDRDIFGAPVDPARHFPPALRMYKMLQRTSQEFGPTQCNALARMHRETAGFGATDERDKIYGLLALCLEKDRIMADYSIPTLDFLKNLVRDHIKSTQTLEILLGNRRLERNGRPSWTPELSGFELQSPAWLYSNLARAGLPERESRGMEVQFDLPKGLLHVRGFTIAQVSKVIGPFPASLLERRGANAAKHTSTYANPLKRMLGYLEELFEFAKSLDPDSRRQCWRALLLDLNHKGLDQFGPMPDHYGELFDILVGVRPAPLHLTSPGMDSQLMTYLQPVYNQIEANLAERCFFTINDEFMAVGPYHTKPGDMVVILFGGAQCFILRPCCCGAKFELIGDAYVYRFMDGNVCKDVLDGRMGEMKPRRFLLR